MMTMPARPEHLSEEYELVGPTRLFITADYRAAYKANHAFDAIRTMAGARSSWMPMISPNLRLIDQPGVGLKTISRAYKAHSTTLLQGVPEPGPRDLLFAGRWRHISTEGAYLLGQAVESPEVGQVYFLGSERGLGKLASQENIEVIHQPLEVFRWQHPGGAFQRLAPGDME